jgi:hypothetical protein
MINILEAFQRKAQVSEFFLILEGNIGSMNKKINQ